MRDYTAKERWLLKLSIYRERYLAAKERFFETNRTIKSPKFDGMPHGGNVSNSVAVQVEKYNRAYVQYEKAKAEYQAAQAKRRIAMDKLPPVQKLVLQRLYLQERTVTQTAADLHVSEKTIRIWRGKALAELQLPQDWYTDL